MIEVKDLTKRYGTYLAVRGISFGVQKGEVVGFLGPNGAGKSTTLRILAGFLGPTSGDVRVAGFSVTDEPLKVRERLGYMPESAPLYPEMRVREYLCYRAELKGVSRSARAGAVGRAAESTGTSDVLDVLIGQLSKGYRQRVGLADALVASPPLLILDEPTAGLDPNQIREVRALIQRLAEEHTILVSTHILSEVEAMCSRGIVIARGELVAEGSIEELRSLRRARAVRLRLRGDAAAVKAAVAGVDGTSEVTIEPVGGSHVLLDVTFASADAGDQVTERLVAALASASIGVLQVVPQSSLEQVFAELTGATEEAV